MPSRDLGSACTSLVNQLDASRRDWFEMAKRLVEEGLATAREPSTRIVNHELLDGIDIGMVEEEIPHEFPWRSVDGQTVEAALIACQSMSSLAFSLKRGYLTEADFQSYTSALLAACQDNARWAISFGALFGDSISPQSVGSVLARFLLNDKTDRRGVLIAAHLLEERAIPLLVFLTRLDTATAFADATLLEALMINMSQ